MNIKSVVSALGLFGFLTAAAAGILDCGTDDMHWRPVPPGPGSSLSAPQFGGETVDNLPCEIPICDDMHW